MLEKIIPNMINKIKNEFWSNLFVFLILLKYNNIYLLTNNFTKKVNVKSFKRKEFSLFSLIE